MKGKRGRTEDFRVPLSKEAQSVVADAMSISRDGFLFPSIRKGVISDSTLSKHMRDKELARCASWIQVNFANMAHG